MIVNWPDSLLDDFCDKRVIIVIGAGVSRRSVSKIGVERNPPLWREFLENAVKRHKIRTKHIKEAIVNRDYLSACEWIKSRLDENWAPFLIEEFLTPSYQPNLIHDKIFRLDQRVTFSLNFDMIYERFVTQKTDGRTLVKNYYDEDVYKFLRDKSFYVIKLHGSADSPNSIIFSESDYAEARAESSAFFEVLDASILSHTFVFIGCGFDDPNIRLLLETHKFKFPQAQPHYIFTSKRVNKDQEQSMRKNRNLKCIKYDTANNHEKLGDVLDELLMNVELKISGRMAA